MARRSRFLPVRDYPVSTSGFEYAPAQSAGVLDHATEHHRPSRGPAARPGGARPGVSRVACKPRPVPASLRGTCLPDYARSEPRTRPFLCCATEPVHSVSHGSALETVTTAGCSRKCMHEREQFRERSNRESAHFEIELPGDWSASTVLSGDDNRSKGERHDERGHRRHRIHRPPAHSAAGRARRGRGLHGHQPERRRVRGPSATGSRWSAAT